MESKNEAPRGKSRDIKAKFFRSQPSYALRATEGFSSPSSPPQATGYSAKENKKFLGLGFQTVFLLLFISLGVLSFDYVMLLRDDIHSSVNKEISQTTQAVAFEQEGWIGRTSWLLQLLANFSEIKKQSNVDCSKILSQITAIYPHYVNLGLAKTNGDVFCSAFPSTTPINISNKTWFRRTIQNKKFSIGEYQMGDADKKASIYFSYPILDKNELVQSVIFTALDLDWITTLFSRVKFSEGSALFLVDGRGLILTTNLELEKWIGKLVPEAKVLQEILNFKTGTVEARDINGTQTIYAYTPLAGEVGCGIFYIIGIPSKFISSQIQKVIVQDIFVFVISLIILLLIRVVWQKLHRNKIES